MHIGVTQNTDNRGKKIYMCTERARTRTWNLLLRRQTRYPLRHTPLSRWPLANHAVKLVSTKFCAEFPYVAKQYPSFAAGFLFWYFYVIQELRDLIFSLAFSALFPIRLIALFNGKQFDIWNLKVQLKSKRNVLLQRQTRYHCATRHICVCWQNMLLNMFRQKFTLTFLMLVNETFRSLSVSNSSIFYVIPEVLDFWLGLFSLIPP